jgi:uncharacterized membrane protein
MKKRNNNKNVFNVVIEILWVLMALFTLFSGIRVLSIGTENEWFAWVYFVFSLMCFLMFFFRRNSRKRNQRKAQ